MMTKAAGLFVLLLFASSFEVLFHQQQCLANYVCGMQIFMPIIS